MKLKSKINKQLLKRDILKEIYEKKITEKEASDFLKKALESEEDNAVNLMGLNLENEWTALMLHDISYAVLAKWRYEGWPSICAICHEKLDIDKGGWKAFRSLKINNKILKNVLAHWECYNQMEA